MLNRGRHAAQRGISIIEMVFTVALVAVLMSIAGPSFAAWLERNRVRSATESIHAGIQLARAEAMARNARVRFTLATDGSWAVACTATAPGCPDTAALHERSGAESRGRFSMLVNSAAPAGATGVSFGGQGRPDTTESGRIQQIDASTPTAVDAASTSRALRILLSDFGRTRMCYPHAALGNPTRC